MKEVKSYLQTKCKKNCTGCGSCKSVCPKDAITMVQDEEGFAYPQINKEKCINCHLCEKTCPIIKTRPVTRPQALLYVTRKEKDLLCATSGGAFGDIVNSFFEKEKTFIYGCTFNENNEVVHLGVNSIDGVNQFKKSKYVQSNLLNVYEEIKQNLLAGYKVLFSGTPCQVSGLKAYLNKKYDNLLCVDFVCHGVPSQKVFNCYLKSEEDKHNSKIKNVSFREKILKDDGKYDSRNIKLTFNDGSTVVYSADESTYLIGFHNRLFYRPSCYNCKFASIARDSDITICDAWGKDIVSAGFDDKKGVSCVIINSSFGNEIVNKLDGIKHSIPIDIVIDYNECYTHSTILHKNRGKFFKKLTLDNFDEMSLKYSKTFVKKLKIFAKKVLKK